MPDGPGKLKDRVLERLQSIRADKLERFLRPPSGIDFSSNDYLGLSAHPRIRQAMIDAIARDGVGSTGSRLLRGDRTAFTDVEKRFAEFKGAERALYFSSGYLANLAVMTTLPERGDFVFSDERNHASLIDAIRLSPAARVVVPHLDTDTIGQAIAEHSPSGQIFFVTESLFSMDGDIAPLKQYAALCRLTGAMLVVDEAHAVGTYGARGSGLLEHFGLDANSYVSINTAGKALGVTGAFVAGPAWAIDYLIQRARPFIFTTAPPPSVAAALAASLDVLAAEPERRARLTSRVTRLHTALAARGIFVPHQPTHIIPIVIGDNDRALAAAERLQSQGFDVRAIRPPSVPRATARLRLSVNADLDDETIDRFAAVLSGVLHELTINEAPSWSAASS